MIVELLGIKSAILSRMRRIILRLIARRRAGMTQVFRLWGVASPGHVIMALLELPYHSGEHL